MNRDSPIKPRRLVRALVTEATLLLSAEAALALLVQLYLKDLGSSALVISLSGSLGWVGTLVASPFWGVMGDRFAARRLLVLILAGAGLATSSLSLLLAAPAVLVLGLVRRLLANGLAPIGMKMISVVSAPKDRGRNLAYLSAARSAGFVFGGILGGVLLERIGFRGAFLVVASLPIVSLLVVRGVPVLKASPQRTSLRADTLHILKHSPLGLLYIGVILRQLATSGVGALAFVYMAEFSISSETMGVISAVNPAIAVAGTLGFGYLIHRIDRRVALLFGFSVTLLYPLGYAFATSPIAFALAAAPIGLSFASYYPSTTAAIAEQVPDHLQGAMFGLLDSSRGVGGLIGPIVAGGLVTAFGYRPMFLVMAGFALLAVVFVHLSNRSLPGGRGSSTAAAVPSGPTN